MVTYTTCQTDLELLNILALQTENLRSLQSIEIEAEQGFVTVHHSFEVIKMMNDHESHIIAKVGDQVIGYALAMSERFKNKVPELFAFFEKLDSIAVDGKPLNQYKYIVMGQICIQKDYRGIGIFSGLYDYFFKIYGHKYQYLITEVAARNTRSLRAHEKVGFKTIHMYEEQGFENWVVICKKMSNFPFRFVT